jgi:alpha-mannosidase
VVERVVARSAHPMITRNPKNFHPEDPGPDFSHTAAAGVQPPEREETDEYAAITWQTSAPGVPTISSTLRLYRNLEGIDLDVRLVKPESFEPESVFVAFPFGLTHPRFLLETAGAVYEAEMEQLLDTSKDWYSIQHAAGITDGTSGILWGTRDAPLVQLGGFHTGQWARHLDAPVGHINSWLMNNLHFTNFQARQDGTGTYRYRFLPVQDAVSHERVRRYGRDLLQGLWARQYAGPVRLDGASGLRVEPAATLLAEARPVAGGVRVRVRNISASPVSAHVFWDGPLVEPAQSELPLGGFGVTDLILRRV